MSVDSLEENCVALREVRDEAVLNAFSARNADREAPVRNILGIPSSGEY